MLYKSRVRPTTHGTMAGTATAHPVSTYIDTSILYTHFYALRRQEAMMPKAAELDQNHTNHAQYTRHGRILTLGSRTRIKLADITAVARAQIPVSLSRSAELRVQAARDLVENLCTQDRTVYGVTTGFGHLSSVKIPGDQLAE